MGTTGDRPFGWIAALAIASGVLVLVPSLIAAGISVLAALAKVFQ